MFKYIFLCFFALFGLQASDTISLDANEATVSVLVGNDHCLLICRIKPEGSALVRTFRPEALQVSLKQDGKSDKAKLHHEYSFITLAQNDKISCDDRQATLYLSPETLAQIVAVPEGHFINLAGQMDVECVQVFLDAEKKREQEDEKARSLSKKISGNLARCGDYLHKMFGDDSTK